MTDFDKTKENIRLHEIDDSQRKELFSKFTDAGGEVISERAKRRSMIIDREKQAEHRRRLDEHYAKNSKALKKKKITPTPPPGRNVSSDSGKEHILFFDKFRIRMRLRLYGVTKFNIAFFNPKFFVKFNDEYKKSLMELQLAYFYFFKENPENGRRIINRLDKLNPIYYEVIEKLGEIFDPIKIDRILEHHRAFPDVSQTLSELATPITELFREIYIVKPYENSVYAAFDKTFDIFEKISSEKGRKFTKRQIKNALFIVFHRLFPRLHTLFCHYQNFLFNEIDSGIEDFLSIIQSEIPGNRKLRKLEEQLHLESQDSVESKSPSKEETEREDPLFKKGLEIMAEVNLSELSHELRKNKDYAFLDESDPVLRAYLFFLEFDKEYSFILISNKIQYNLDFTDHDRIDYKKRMQNYFNEMTECQDIFNSYLESCLAYDKIRSQKPMIQDQYIAYSKRLDGASKRKVQIGKTVYSTMRKFMSKLSVDLTALIKDLDEEQKYIKNPQDVLTFDYSVEGDKKLNKMKVYEALRHANAFSKAFSIRLGEGGDLRSREKPMEKGGPKEKAKSQARSNNGNSPEGGDILSELEDLL